MGISTLSNNILLAFSVKGSYFSDMWVNLVKRHLSPTVLVSGQTVAAAITITSQPIAAPEKTSPTIASADPHP
jgi:hypothetical protein